MSKLLLDEHPLLVMPELAKRIGLNESIVMQQIHYWNEINKKAKNNFKDGYYWTFNTYEEWQKQFPFWSDKTIRRIFTFLENHGLVISSNYNKLQIDRTKWYRINYEALKNLESFSCGQNDLFIWSSWYDQWVKMTLPLPEINTEITAENNPHKTPNQNSARTLLFFSKDEDETVNQTTTIVTYYYDQYYLYKRVGHPKLKVDQLNHVYDSIMSASNNYGFGLDDWEKMIDIHLERCHRSKNNDMNINAFASEKNVEILSERLRCG